MVIAQIILTAILYMLTGFGALAVVMESIEDTKYEEKFNLLLRIFYISTWTSCTYFYGDCVTYVDILFRV